MSRLMVAVAAGRRQYKTRTTGGAHLYRVVQYYDSWPFEPDSRVPYGSKSRRRTSWPPGAAGLGLGSCDLDGLVHDAHSRQASETNNDGLEAQVRFLVESYGAGRARSLLSDLPLRKARGSLRRAEQRPPSAPRG